MLNLESGCKIYLCTGQTDMRKGVNGLSILAQSVISDNLTTGALFVFRGKSADKINLPPTESSGYESGVNACLQKLKFSHFTQNPQNPSHPIL